MRNYKLEFQTTYMIPIVSMVSIGPVMVVTTVIVSLPTRSVIIFPAGHAAKVSVMWSFYRLSDVLTG